MKRIIKKYLMEEQYKINFKNSEQSTARGCTMHNHPLVGNKISEFSCSKLATYNWLKEISELPEVEKFPFVEVRFKHNHKEFYLLPEDENIVSGDIVAVETTPGHNIGIVTLTGETARLQMKRKRINIKKEDALKIYRKAKQSDIDKWISSTEKEAEALSFSRKAAEKLGLKMKFNDVEYQGDGTKAIFYYTAEDRVDFRELIKVLAEKLHIRIEMKQIGTRQEAGHVGGIGPCGRELCCCSWISDFQSVSTSSAKVQQLATNPQKLAGQCSKLKCCLNYELEAYADALKDFPSEKIIIKTKDGDACIQKIDVFAKIIWFAYSTNQQVMFPLSLENTKEIIKQNQQGQVVEPLESWKTQEVSSQSIIELTIEDEDVKRFDKGKNRKGNRK